jgi:ATP-dependent Lon protease
MSMELVKTQQAPEEQQITIPDVLPVLPMPDMVVFPYMIVPLFVNRDKSAKAVDQALAENRMIMLVAQKNPDVDDPKPSDLYDFGTVSIIMRMLKMPDGRVRILVQGFSRAKVEFFDESKPYLTAKVQPKAEPQVIADSIELEALIRNVKSGLEKIVSLGKNISADLVAIASNLDDPAGFDLVASNLNSKSKSSRVLEVEPIARLPRQRTHGAKWKSLRSRTTSIRRLAEKWTEPARVLPASTDEGYPAGAW